MMESDKDDKLIELSPRDRSDSNPNRPRTFRRKQNANARAPNEVVRRMSVRGNFGLAEEQSSTHNSMPGAFPGTLKTSLRKFVGEPIVIEFTNTEGKNEEVNTHILLDHVDDTDAPAASFRVVRQVENPFHLNQLKVANNNTQSRPLYAPETYGIPVLVVIPCFNEEPDVVFRTLLSTHENGQHLYGKQLGDVNKFGAATHAVLILDGYTKASKKTIKWLESFFAVEVSPENDPWRYLSRLKENKQEDKEVVNWFVDKADKTHSYLAGGETESLVPSVSWNPGEVYKWVARFNESTAQSLLRNKINGDKLFRLSQDSLCDRYGLELDAAIELLCAIDSTKDAAGEDRLKNIAVVFQCTYKKNLFPFRIARPSGDPDGDFLFSKSGCYCSPCDFENPPDADSLCTFLTVIVKCRNRQKHNSHWWAIQPDYGFVAQYPKSTYVWFTDCGTLFGRDCLFYLWTELKADSLLGDKTGAVTGRQRVMNAKQQGDKGEGFIAEILRHVQRCDFELSFASTVGAFTAVGALPVLPGPCALFKSSILLGGANTFYHSYLHMEDLGLIEANVMIAEDRVLSISPFFVDLNSEQSSWTCSDTRMNTVVAPQATFFFESEDNIMSLVKQRRRWINGTIAAYVWMLYKKPSLIWLHFNMSVWRKICFWWFCFTQAYSYFFVFMAPAIFIVAFKIAVEKFPIPSEVKNQLQMPVWWLFVTVLYVLFSILSSYRHTEDWTMYIGMLLGMILEVFTVVSVVWNLVIIGTDPPTTSVINSAGQNVTVLAINYYDFSALGIVIIYLLIPLLSALFAQPKSFLYILRSGLYFFLFLPTLVGLFGCYAICNFSDFSWGNRDSSGAEDRLGNRVKTLKARGNVFGWLFLLFNVVFIIISSQLVDAYPLYKPLFAGFVFLPQLTVIITSLIYWVYWRIKWLILLCFHCGKGRPLPLESTGQVNLQDGRPSYVSSDGTGAGTGTFSSPRSYDPLDV